MQRAWTKHNVPQCGYCQAGQIMSAAGLLKQNPDPSLDEIHAATVDGHLSHSPMEPMASAAWVTDDACEIWASTQDPRGIQETVGAYLDTRLCRLRYTQETGLPRSPKNRR